MVEEVKERKKCCWAEGGQWGRVGGRSPPVPQDTSSSYAQTGGPQVWVLGERSGLMGALKSALPTARLLWGRGDSENQR